MHAVHVSMRRTPYTCQYARPSVHSFVRPSVRPVIRPSVHSYVCSSVRSFVRPFICPSICLVCQRLSFSDLSTFLIMLFIHCSVAKCKSKGVFNYYPLHDHEDLQRFRGTWYGTLIRQQPIGKPQSLVNKYILIFK